MNQSVVVYDDSGKPAHLVLAPHATTVYDSEAGQVLEVNYPEGVELNLEVYHCQNPLCLCADDYYATISIKISKSEYDRIRQTPGWTISHPEQEADDDDNM